MEMFAIFVVSQVGVYQKYRGLYNWMVTATATTFHSTRSLTAHAYRLLVLTVLLRPVGNLSLAWGMKHFAQLLGLNPLAYITALFNPFVAAGIAMLVLSLFTRMALLSLADLSFVLPLTAIGYIITTFLGKFFLNEQVSPLHWAGTALVFLGVAVVSSTSLRTAAATPEVS